MLILWMPYTDIRLITLCLRDQLHLNSACVFKVEVERILGKGSNFLQCKPIRALACLALITQLKFYLAVFFFQPPFQTFILLGITCGKVSPFFFCADDFNRVILSVKRGQEFTDYINASFIDVSAPSPPLV